MLNDISNRNLKTGVILTVITALYLIIHSCIIGRNEFFLLLNTDLGSVADIFFKLCTNLGDGIVWVLVAILFYIYHRKRFPLLIAAIIISTLITQLTKNYAFPAESRPTAAITDSSLIHTVSGVELHTAYSFPSGHTATAFSIFLIACLLIKNRWVVPVGFVWALLVAYSRVYLAQHFPLDLGGGMLAAVVTIFLSIGVQKKFDRKD
ncbi:MAG: phosphatase PAP2 family protein [Bacteroidota bacterium]